MKNLMSMTCFLVCAAVAVGCIDELPIDQERAAIAAKKGPDQCPAVTFAHDVDVPRVHVRGDFLVNGAAPPESDAETAVIELRSQTLGVVELGQLHTGSYQRWVIPGVYDVVYRYSQGDLVPKNAETVILPGVQLASSTRLDIDIPSVAVTGSITLNGNPPPQGYYERGEIRLRDPNTGAAFEVGTSDDGSSSAVVIPGVYDVIWSRLLGDSVVPVNSNSILAEAVEVSGATALDVDVPAVLRTGTFTLNGESPPAGVYENGQVLLRDTRSGEVLPLGETRLQTYSQRIVPGTYDVIYSRLLGTTTVPRNELAVLAEGVELLEDGDLAIDIPVVTVQGAFALDGSPFPQGYYDRGRMWLRGSEENDVFDIGTTDEGGYEVRVIPGTYDVVYQKVLSTGLVPENSWSVVSTRNKIVAPKRSSSRPARLDIAVSSGIVAADVTVWGAPPPGGYYEYGEIRAAEPAGGSVVLGTTFDAGGSARMVDGSYDLRYAHLLGSMVPQNGDASVGTAAAEPLMIPVALDLQPGTMSGTFSQAGELFPADESQSGNLMLRDKVTGDLVELGSTASQSYSLSLLGGSYEVVYEHVAGESVVANRGATLGCVTFTPPAPLQDQGL